MKNKRMVAMVSRLHQYVEGNVFSHLPYVSSRVRSDNDEDWNLTERKRKGMIEYPLQTKPGISGGAVVVNDCIVGKTIHNGLVYTPGHKQCFFRIFMDFQ